MSLKFIDINRIHSAPLDLDQPVAFPSVVPTAPDEPEVLEAHIRGTATRSGARVEFEARMSFRVRLTCSRCLETYESGQTTDFRLILVPDAIEFGAGETEMEPDDASLFYAEQGRAEIAAIAREQILLDQPLKPVCRADCAGLCPTCGGNKNRLKCGCGAEPLDPRLAPLLEIQRSHRRRNAPDPRGDPSDHDETTTESKSES